MLDTPIFWIMTTLSVWVASVGLSHRHPEVPLLNPTLITIAVLIGILLLTSTDYLVYQNGGQFIQFMLAPATVAIGISVGDNIDVIRRNFVPLIIATTAGCFVAICSTIISSHLLGLPKSLVMSMVPSSITAAAAIDVSKQTGGDPSLTACFVVIAGLVGAIFARVVLGATKSNSAAGVGLGVGSHGIGTARTYALDPLAGLFAGIGMALSAVVAPVLIRLMV